LTLPAIEKPEFSLSGLKSTRLVCFSWCNSNSFYRSVGATSVNLRFPSPRWTHPGLSKTHLFESGFVTDHLLKFLTISQIPNRNSISKRRCKFALSIAWILWLSVRTNHNTRLLQRSLRPTGLVPCLSQNDLKLSDIPCEIFSGFLFNELKRPFYLFQARTKCKVPK
jgi:hypothetical protein